MKDYRVRKKIEHIDYPTREIIKLRYQEITRAINRQFWGRNNESDNTFFVGSYGRGTAISTSDIDMIAVLPDEYYNKYSGLTYNGQSALLQAVKKAVEYKYPRTYKRADGQVIIVEFSDDIKFEILPAFDRQGGYLYPDSNYGGRWRVTNPEFDQYFMRECNRNSKGLFVDTCKHIRRIKSDFFSSYYLSGIVIDTFVYDFLTRKNTNEFYYTWEVVDAFRGTELKYYYEEELLEYVSYVWGLNSGKLSTPGGDEIDGTKSKECFFKVLKKMAGE